ncbi:MAG: spore germination protein [Coprococcus sp.]
MGGHNRKEQAVLVDACLDKNILWITSIFEGCDDAVMRKIIMGPQKLGIYVIYMDSMYDRDLVDGVLLKNLLFDVDGIPEEDAGDFIVRRCLATADIKKVKQLDKMVDEVLKGNTGILIDGMPEAVIISSKNLPGRGVQSAETEVSVRGSKESFTESFRTNTVLIRRRIRDTRLKAKQMTIGVRSRTDVAVMYMDDLVRPRILEEILRKLDGFRVDAILDSGSLEQLTEDKWYSPFPQFQATERPDKAASALLEGRIVLVVDNSPMVLLLPATFSCFFQASDDYYNRWDVACFVRMLRYGAAAAAMLLPGLYIALAGFHPEALPLSFALSFAASREGVPFSLPLEVLVMEIAFELLREAGIRLPGPMGSTLGIVGGLIIGQAAVDAHIVSPVVVIIVALTALSAFTVPNDLFASAFRMIKFYFIIAAAIGGFAGLTAAMLTVMIHLAGLKSFGVPYMMPFVSAEMAPEGRWQDTVVKSPGSQMYERPFFTKEGHRRRLRKEKNGR